MIKLLISRYSVRGTKNESATVDRKSSSFSVISSPSEIKSSSWTRTYIFCFCCSSSFIFWHIASILTAFRESLFRSLMLSLSMFSALYVVRYSSNLFIYIVTCSLFRCLERKVLTISFPCEVMTVSSCISPISAKSCTSAFKIDSLIL